MMSTTKDAGDKIGSSARRKTGIETKETTNQIGKTVMNISLKSAFGMAKSDTSTGVLITVNAKRIELAAYVLA